MKTPIRTRHFPSRSLAALGLLALLGAPVTFAQTNPSNNAMSSGMQLNREDRSFVQDAAKSGETEVAISQVAESKTTNPEIRDFAQMIVRDHTDANSKLMSLAASKNVKLSTEAPKIDKWEKMSGKDFDEDYLDKMVDDHQDAVKLFEKEAKNGSDSDLTSFASSTLPTLQKHLDRAKTLKAAVK